MHVDPIVRPRAPDSDQSISESLFFVLGGTEIEGADLTLRYWYTAEAGGGTSPSQSTGCDGSEGLSFDSMWVSLVPVTPPRPTADTYVEIRFPTDLGILSTGYTFWISFHVTRNDGSPYNQTNDYSHNDLSQAAPTNKVTAYLKGALIYGTEP